MSRDEADNQVMSHDEQAGSRDKTDNQDVRGEQTYISK